MNFVEFRYVKSTNQVFVGLTYQKLGTVSIYVSSDVGFTENYGLLTM
jgi:hypothetical protein